MIIKYRKIQNSLLVIKELVESGYCDRLICECELYDEPDDAINRYLKKQLPDQYKDMDNIYLSIIEEILDC